MKVREFAILIEIGHTDFIMKQINNSQCIYNEMKVAYVLSSRAVKVAVPLGKCGGSGFETQSGGQLFYSISSLWLILRIIAASSEKLETGKLFILLINH